MGHKIAELTFEISDLNLDHIALVYGDDRIPAVSEAYARMSKSTAQWLPEGYHLIEKNAYSNAPDSDLELLLKTDKELQMVWMPVLIPDKIDRQGDIITSQEIEKTRIRFMENYKHGRVNGIGGISGNHEEFKKDFGTIVDSFIDYQGNFFDKVGKSIKNAWVVGFKLNEEMWSLYKSGQIKGCSIGGLGKRKKIKKNILVKSSLNELVDLANRISSSPEFSLKEIKREMLILNSLVQSFKNNIKEFLPLKKEEGGGY